MWRDAHFRRCETLKSHRYQQSGNWNWWIIHGNGAVHVLSRFYLLRGAGRASLLPHGLTTSQPPIFCRLRRLDKLRVANKHYRNATANAITIKQRLFIYSFCNVSPRCVIMFAVTANINILLILGDAVWIFIAIYINYYCSYLITFCCCKHK